MFPGPSNKSQGGSMKPRWGTGIYFGKLWRSDECMVFADDGKLVIARSIKLMVDSESWSAEAIEKLTITRWKAQSVTAHTPMEVAEGICEEPVARPVIPKDFSITREPLEKHGYSVDCTRCRRLNKNKDAKGTHHTIACRDRFRKILEDEDPDVIARAEERKDEFMASQVQAAAENSSAANGGSGDPGSSTRGGAEHPPTHREHLKINPPRP